MRNQKGQVVIVMLLTLLVTLSIGLLITQKSITDVTTSTQTEQGSRAFSAAEAGIEQAISQGGTALTITTLPDIAESELGNQASATHIKISPDVPTGINEALEYPKVGRDQIAQFWLSDPVSLLSFYTSSSLDLYFGNQDIGNYPISQLPSIEPAVEITIITKDVNNNNYLVNSKKFYDSNSSRSGPSGNSFVYVASGGSVNTFNPNIFTISPSTFYRKVNVPINACTLPGCYPVMARVRLLYSSINQKVAIGPLSGARLPAQANIYSSTGRAGQSEKNLQVFRQKFILPPFLDFAIFSSGNITK